jgi:hypothetical protein
MPGGRAEFCFGSGLAASPSGSADLVAAAPTKQNGVRDGGGCCRSIKQNRDRTPTGVLGSARAATFGRDCCCE